MNKLFLRNEWYCSEFTMKLLGSNRLDISLKMEI